MIMKRETGFCRVRPNCGWRCWTAKKAGAADPDVHLLRASASGANRNSNVRPAMSRFVPVTVMPSVGEM